MDYSYIYNVLHSLPSVSPDIYPHLASPGFPNMFYFHPFPPAGRCDSKNLGSVEHQPMPAFFPSFWETETVFPEVSLFVGFGAGSSPGLFPLFPSFLCTNHGWYDDCIALAAEATAKKHPLPSNRGGRERRAALSPLSILWIGRKLFCKALPKPWKWAGWKERLWMGMEKAETWICSSILY